MAEQGVSDMASVYALAEGSDAAAIAEILYTRDIAAIVEGDWDAVASDFDENAFVAYSAAVDGTWAVTFPRLADYRRSWLGQAANLAGSPNLRAELLAAQRLSSIEVAGDRALVRKEFDGDISTPEGRTTLDWTTYYFLRRDHADGKWLITGFVGYLPRPTEWNGS